MDKERNGQVRASRLHIATLMERKRVSSPEVTAFHRYDFLAEPPLAVMTHSQIRFVPVQRKVVHDRSAFHRATVDLPKRTHRTIVRVAWSVATWVTPPNRPTTPLPATSRNISRWFGVNRPL